MKILIIYTGGTIGSSLENGVISTNSDTNKSLIALYNKRCESKVEFEEITPFTMLSETLCASRLNLIISTIKSKLNGPYDGIILTHGTDTLQYTAAALSYALGETNMPIMIVSSNYPLDDKRANGFDNFEAAVDFILKGHARGVFVSYKNENEIVKIHKGTNLLPQRLFSDYIECVASKPCEISIKPIDFTLVEYPRILTIECHPANSYEYDLSCCNAIIIKAYHSGTLDTDNDMFIEFCNKAKKAQIPVFLVNCTNGNIYESATVFDELNIISLPYCSPITAYVKAWIAISAGLPIKNFMLENL